MKVVLVCSSNELGGGELFTYALAKGLRNAGCDAWIATDPAQRFGQRLGKDGFPTLPIVLGPKLSKRTSWRFPFQMISARRELARLTRSVDVDVWVLQYKLEQLLWGRSPGSLVALEHGPVPAPLLKMPLARARLGRFYRRCARVFAVSDVASASLAALGTSSRLFVAGIDQEEADRQLHDRGRLRDQFGFQDNERVVAFVGRAVINKGILDFVELIARNPMIRGVVAGVGPALEDAKQLAQRKGCSGRIKFLGFVDNPLEVLAASDLFVIPTQNPTEGRPLAVLDSLSVGTPVLGTTHPVLLEMRDREGLPLTLVDEVSAVNLDDVDNPSFARPTNVDLRSWADAATEFVELLKED